MRRRIPALAWIGRLDDAVYGAERIVVTAAMLIMSAVVCINVLFQFMARQKATWQRLGDTTSIIDFWPGIGVLLAVALLSRGVWAHSPACRRNPALVYGLTAATLVGFAAFSVSLLLIPSSVVLAITLVVCGAWVMLAEFDRPRPLGTPRFDAVMKLRLTLTAACTLAMAALALRVTPENYSWTTKLALFLLLWTAFIGASMATHDQRHLTIDAIRKTISARLLPYYQGLSHLVAATFTAAFTVLAFLYLNERLGETALSNEIPDWLKVLAIPVSLLLVTLRFAGQSIAAFMAGALGLVDEGEPAKPGGAE